MKTFKIRKNTWHYRLASVYADLSIWEDEINICSYISNVFKGFCIACLTSVVVGVILGTYIGYIPAWVVSMFYLGHFICPDFIIVALLVMSLLPITLIFLEIPRVQTIIFGLQDGFMMQAIMSFKEKTCWKVQLIDK